MEQAHYSVGDLATRFGVSTESLRNWERQKLIPPAQRTPGKHRRYTDEHVAAIAKLMTPTAPATEAGETHAH